SKMGIDCMESSSAEKDLGIWFDKGLGGIGGWKTDYEPAMCTHSPESQLYPGLHQEKCDQQVKGGDSAPLHCSHETPPG
ncbi:unnamed protein product, partial [Bubo scandiacus]